MRKLASIQEIWRIEPIEGADRIELAHVLGWQCVVNKGQFTAPCKAVYFEIDSFLPVEDRFEFLRKSCFKTSDVLGDGFKLTTKTFKGQISQGLCLPLSDFPEIPEGAEVGTDVTDLLKVRKWEIGERLTGEGTVKGERPASIPYTDETRIQNAPELIAEFTGLPYYITTKLDGSSHSIGIDEEGFHVTSHNYEYTDGRFYNFVVSKGYKDSLEKYVDGGHTLVLQGELCGSKIQGNPMKLSGLEWYVFTAVQDGKRLSLPDMQRICVDLGIPMVPVEETGDDLPSKYPDVQALLKRAGQGESLNGTRKEGIVIRPVSPIYSAVLKTYLSMKVINNEYLLKQK